MTVLIACEESQTVCKAFRAKGHNAYSCDILECSGGHPEWHIVGDAVHTAYNKDYKLQNGQFLHIDQWDLMIAHPPCTYLAVSGIHWNYRRPERQALTESSLEFVRQLMQSPINAIAIENPVSVISTRIRKPDQIIQPWWFGDDASKKTCLWLKNLPLLKETDRLPGDHKTRRANQTASGQNKLGPSPDRAKLRSVTYPGIALAMATQWGSL